MQLTLDKKAWKGVNGGQRAVHVRVELARLTRVQPPTAEFVITGADDRESLVKDGADIPFPASLASVADIPRPWCIYLIVRLV